MDLPYFEDILEREMLDLGYQGLFVQKAPCTGRQEGVALFYKRDKFDLKEARTLVINDIAADVLAQTEWKEFGEVLILAALQHRTSGVVLVIGKIPSPLPTSLVYNLQILLSMCNSGKHPLSPHRRFFCFAPPPLPRKFQFCFMLCF